MTNNLKISKVAIIGCVHGDEPIGQKVINKLKSLSAGKKISIQGIIANRPAVKKKKRMVRYDLNRIFPGKKNGRHEERIAYCLKKQLSQFDLSIDIHATNSSIGSMIIVTRLNKQIKRLLTLIPIKKVAYMSSHEMSRGSLVHHTPLGICLEYGPDKSGKNYTRAVDDLKVLMSNLNSPQERARFPNKTLYRVHGAYQVPKKFRPNPRLKDFIQIIKGDPIGFLDKEKVLSTRTFYPIFLGKGRYESTLALTATKEKLKL